MKSIERKTKQKTIKENCQIKLYLMKRNEQTEKKKLTIERVNKRTERYFVTSLLDLVLL